MGSKALKRGLVPDRDTIDLVRSRRDWGGRRGMSQSLMTQFSQKLGAYLSGNLDLDALEQVIDAVVAEGDYLDSALSIIEKQRDSGRMAEALFQSLSRRLQGEAPRVDPTAPLSDDATLAGVTEPVSADNAPTTFQPTEKINQHVDATVVVNSHVAPTIKINAHVADTQPIQSEAPARHDPTLPINETPVPSQRLTTGTGSGPFPTGSGPLPTGTGSNWENPEQWIERHKGPVETGVVLKRRFLIEEQLGRGGMGAVFKARDKRKDEAQDRDPFVAIKVLSKTFQEHPKALMALQREARKAQTLAHPNIVTVYDFDRDGTTVYMTMELMRGEPLDRLVRRHKDVGLDPEVARRIIEQMAEGLAYAHEKRIIHSDLKPGNVFLTEDNRVKVLDFGIARAAKFKGEDAGDKTLFDAGDLRSLTPAYASVEMFDGAEPHPSDDVYGLAVTAYLLFTGKHPFDRKTAEQAMELGLQPEPIKGLAKHEWQAIAQGLAFAREDRIEDAGVFLETFRGKQGRQRGLLAAIGGLAAVALFFAVQALQPQGPAFPWEELSLEQQQRFETFVDSGNEWLANDPPWIGGAYNDFAAAFDIHPDNPRATAGLNAVADALIALQPDAISVEEQRRLLKDMETASVNPYLAEHGRLRAAQRRLRAALDTGGT